MALLGTWVWSCAHEAPCLVLEHQDLWDGSVYHVWLPTEQSVERLRGDQIGELRQAPPDPAWLSYVASAARIVEALSEDLLFAPIESSVIPLPHQLDALKRAVAKDPVRFLLADEVGLGKTIEAGLVMRELKLRGQIRRVLVVAPTGLVSQWVSEMRTHFGEEFSLMVPSDFSAYQRITKTENVWEAHDQVVCPMDSVKPSDGRKGWSAERLDEYNRERFENLIGAGWDLIIVDEAHRLGGSTDQVARYRLGRGLAEAAPHLLLLSATPHQGKTEPFHRLMALLDERAFPEPGDITHESVAPYVIRTEKRNAIDPEGRALFRPRTTKLVPIEWDDRHRGQRALYGAVSEYVREGYNRAVQEKRHYVGFLLLLMQRLVTSSTRAIRVTLERRLEALQLPDEQLGLFPDLTADDWADLDGDEQLVALLTSRLKNLRDERAEVSLLLDAARMAEAEGPDPKAEALLEWIYRLQREEGDPELKVLVFTEFVPTQEMLREFLTERGFSVTWINGSMGMEERLSAQESFAEEARIMVSTEAGGEGLNLQFCHIVVNFDVPWNPMRVEQRIGRVDRIGQEHPVLAINLTIEDTVEYRVREVLEEKLEVILEEFGVDKTGDILDSAEAGRIFDDAYAESILRPANVDKAVDQALERLREGGREHRRTASLLGTTESFNADEAKRVMEHPFSFWLERMTTSYLRSRGGSVVRENGAWRLRWPEADDTELAVFSTRGLSREPSADHLTLADERVRSVVYGIPPVVPGMPIPILHLTEAPSELHGTWTLWRIGLKSRGASDTRMLTLFVDDEGHVRSPSARFVWEQILAGDFVVAGAEGGEGIAQRSDLESLAREYGRDRYETLSRAYRERLDWERETGHRSFESRRRAIERIGLPAVRRRRLSSLEAEEKVWVREMERRQETVPELTLVLHARIDRGRDGT